MEQSSKENSKKKKVVTLLLIIVLITCILASLVLLILNNQDPSGGATTPSSNSTSESQTIASSDVTTSSEPPTSESTVKEYRIDLMYYAAGEKDIVPLTFRGPSGLVISKATCDGGFSCTGITGEDFVIGLGFAEAGESLSVHSIDHTFIGTSSLGDIYEFPYPGNLGKFGYTNTILFTDAECAAAPNGTVSDIHKTAPCRRERIQGDTKVFFPFICTPQNGDTSICREILLTLDLLAN